MPQRIATLSGFGLVRILYDQGYRPGDIPNETQVNGVPATEWQYRFLSLAGAGNLLWYADESQLYPEGFAAVTSEAQMTGESLKTQEHVLTMLANVGGDGRVATLHIAVIKQEVELWKNMLTYHIVEAEQFGLKGSTASFTGNDTGDKDTDPELNTLLYEKVDAIVTIFLKENKHTLTLAMDGDASSLAAQFVHQQGLRNEFRMQIELELVKGQLELYRARDIQVLKQFAKVQQKVHGIVIAEAHASMAESLAAELTDAMSKIQSQIVPDLQGKVTSLEARCKAAEQAAEEAQAQQVATENQYISENVRLKKELQTALRRPSVSNNRSGSSDRHDISPSSDSNPSNRYSSPSKDTQSLEPDDDLDVDALLGNSRPNFSGATAQSTLPIYSPVQTKPMKIDKISPAARSAGNSPGVHSHIADAAPGPFGQDKLMTEVQELRQVKVALGKKLRACQDELNSTLYELNRAYGKKAEQRKKLNFTDILEEPEPLSTDALKVQLHKQKERIEALLGTKYSNDKEREALYIQVGELQGKVDALEIRCATLQTEKAATTKKMLDMQDQHDFRTIEQLQGEIRQLREEALRFRGESVQLRARIDEITRNAASVLQYPGMKPVDTASTDAPILTISSRSSASTPLTSFSPPPPPPRMFPVPSGENGRLAASEALPSRPTATASVAAGGMTPRSSLLSSYPMPVGGAGREASAEAKDSGTTLFRLFDSVGGVVGATPLSSAASIADITTGSHNDTSVKWFPSEQNALAQRLSPIVEDRLLRLIYHRYIFAQHKAAELHVSALSTLPSASNGATSAAFAHPDNASGTVSVPSYHTMTLGRFNRFAKEFHLCFVGSGGPITCTPPYLVSGEIDVIFANAAKLKVPNDDSSRENLRPYGFRAGAGSDKQYKRGMSSSQTTGLTLTPGQFIEAVKTIACKLYANVIELQTGTTLDCLPPRQKKAAARAVFDVLIRKKLLPIAQRLELVPWSLIYLEQTVNVLGEHKVMQQCLSSYFPQLTLWFDHYKTTYAPPSASAIMLSDKREESGETLASSLPKVGITYRSMSKFARDFGIIPYLVKEPQLYGMFQEFMLWASALPDELHKSLPKDVISAATKHESGDDDDDLAETVSFGDNETRFPFGMSPRLVVKQSPLKVSRSPAGRGDSSLSASGADKAPTPAKGTPLPLCCGLPTPTTPNCRLSLTTFTTFFGAIAQNAFPDHAPEHRLLKLFEICAQSGGTYLLLASAENPEHRAS